MKKNGKDFKKEKNICGVMLEDEKKNCFLARRSVLWIFLFFLSFLSFSFAFSGPTQNPPSGNGTLQVDANQNFGIVSSPGDISPAQGTFGKVFTVASSSNPGISIFDVNDAKRFTWYVDSSGNLKLWYNTASSGADRLSVSSGGSITSYGPVYSANNPNYYIDPGLSVMPYSAVFAGSVGIGTTSPNTKLQVNGGSITVANYGNWIAVASPGSSGTTYARLLGTDVANSYDRAVLTTNGWVNTNNGALVQDNTSLPTWAITLDANNDWIGFKRAPAGSTSQNNLVTFVIVNNSGNVGIGTTSPTNRLNIRTDGSTPAFRISGNPSAPTSSGLFISAIDEYAGAGTGENEAAITVGASFTYASGQISSTWTAGDTSAGGFHIDNGTLNYYANTGLTIGSTFTPTSRFTILNTGNVGIGTTGPTRKLHIAEVGGSTDYGASIKLTNNSTGHLVTDGTDIGLGDGINLYLMNRENGSIKFGTNGAVVMTILNNGNIGIGTTTPAYKLDVQGGQVNSSGGFCIAGDCKTSWSQIQGTSYWALSGNYLYPTSTSYKVGISTTTPAYPLTVVGSSYISNSVYGGDYHSVNNTNYYIDPGLSVMPYSAVFAGNVGIGVSNPLAAIDISGAFYSRMVVKGNCSGAVTIDWSQGNTQHCVLTGNVTFTFINGRSGGNYRLVLKQDSTGGRTVSWPADVRWGAIGVPSLSVVPTKTDYIGFIYNGVDSTYDGVAFNSNY